MPFIHSLILVVGHSLDAYSQNVACKSWGQASGLCILHTRKQELAVQPSSGY